MTTTKKKAAKLKDDNHQEEGIRIKGKQPLGISHQSSRKMITRKWTTKTKKKVVELKEDDHQEEGNKT
jgi:hypothetical protein